MPLEVRNFRAGQKNILAGSRGRLLLLDLEFHHLGRMLDDFGNVGPMTRANFTEDALVDPDDTTNKPVPLIPDTSVRNRWQIKSHTHPKDTNIVE